MKLIRCPECKDVFLAIGKKTRKCECGKHAAKYLGDKLTTVMTDGAMVFGIDNVTFDNAVKRTEYFIERSDEFDYRIDSFFVGWIPNFPGEIIRVETIEDVEEWPYEEEYSHKSTNPSTDLCERDDLWNRIFRWWRE